MRTNHKNQLSLLFPLAGLLGLFSPFTASAQLVTDGATKIISGTSTNLAGDLTVGLHGSGTTLIITNAGTVIDNIGTIGNTNGINNVVIVSGAGSLWTNNSSLIIGEYDAFSQLVISRGAKVVSQSSLVANLAPAHSNSVMVTGAGSVWTNHTLIDVGADQGTYGNSITVSNGASAYGTTCLIGPFNANYNEAIVTGSGSLLRCTANMTVGVASYKNQLTISNGGQVTSDAGGIGYDPFAMQGSGHDNQVFVSGTGSMWTNAADLVIGENGSSNQLFVQNGGMVMNANCLLGEQTGSSNNLVSISGSGSSWINHGDLTVGYNGSFSQVNFGAGTVGASNLYVGAGFIASNNSVTISGGSLYITNTLGTARIEVRRGALTLNSGLLDEDLFFATNGASSQFEFNGGTFITRGGNVSNGMPFAVGTDGSTAGVFDVRAGQNFIIHNGRLFIGSNAPNCHLYITNGGALECRSASSSTVGNNTGSDNNRAVVSGANSLWTNASTLIIGGSGSDNSLKIANGGVVISEAGGNVGATASSTNNSVAIIDANSFWTNGTQTLIGSSGSYNSLVVSNTARFASAALIIGNSAASSNNTVRLESGTIKVVNSGSGYIDVRRGTLTLNSGLLETDQLIATNGANSQFGFNGGTLITRGGSMSNAQPFIVGPDGALPSVLNVRAGQPFIVHNGRFFIGSNAPNCQLYITNGGTLECRSASSSTLGNTAASVNNSALVSGANSLWTNASTLIIGGSGSGNTLRIASGGTVISQAGGNVGAVAASSSNSVVITDGNSGWTNGALTLIGSSGSSNSLVVSNTAWFAAPALALGYNAASSNNTVTLDSGTFMVTNSGSGYIDMRRGALTMNSGLLITDQLIATNGARSQVTFNGGHLQAQNITHSNGSPFVVGTDASFATLELLGNGTNNFAGGVRITQFATLKGNGTIIGNVTNANGGALEPGSSIGRLTLKGNLLLAPGSFTRFELDTAAGTNDAITGLFNVTYGGTLIVTNLAGTLTNGATFQLFTAINYLGAFSSFSAAAPGAGLQWNLNRLPVDGVLRVVTSPSTPPVIGGIAMSGPTNVTITATGGVPYDPVYLVTATNVGPTNATWTVIATNYFNAIGNASITSSFNPGESQRYFRLLVQ